MENFINDLNSSINSKKDQDIIQNLKLLIEDADNVLLKEANTFEKLLNLESKIVLTVACETIAELCKNLENRKVFTNEHIVNKLMHFLQSGKSHHH